MRRKDAKSERDRGGTGTTKGSKSKGGTGKNGGKEKQEQPREQGKLGTIEKNVEGEKKGSKRRA